MNILIFVIVLLVVVIIHESGHFFAAKKAGMRVKEFAFGFKPRLFSWTRGETTYSLNALPLGGYVSIDGEDSTTPGDNRTFRSKSRLAQIWVMFAGPLMNIVLAYVLVVASYIGINTTEANAHPSLVILEVQKGSAAELAGVHAGDKISSIYVEGDIDPSYDPDVEIFQDSISNSNGKNIILEVERNRELYTADITPKDVDGQYRIGVSLGVLESKKLPLGQAFVQGFQDTGDMIGSVVGGFGDMFGKLFTGHSVKDSLMGPIGIAKEVGTVSKFGFDYLLIFTALISINLGILNLLPLPALDGGRIVITAIEAIRRKNFSENVVGVIHTVGFFLLIGLLIFVTVLDVIKIVK